MTSPHTQRNADIRARALAGEALATLAAAFGLSRQRVDQIVNPKKARARARAFKLRRPSTCGSCGSRGKVEAHHPDYDAPLDVLWLCQRCHRGAHRKPRPPRATRAPVVPMDYRINIRFTRGEVAQIDAARKPGESRADFVRAAVAEKIQKEEGDAG